MPATSRRGYPSGSLLLPPARRRDQLVFPPAPPPTTTGPAGRRRPRRASPSPLRVPKEVTHKRRLIDVDEPLRGLGGETSSRAGARMPGVRRSGGVASPGMYRPTTSSSKQGKGLGGSCTRRGPQASVPRAAVSPRKRSKRLVDVDEAQEFVRDLLGDLQGEGEALRGLRRPAGVGRRPVGPVERRVDLDGGQAAGVASQMAPLFREVAGMLLGDRPLWRSRCGFLGLGWSTPPHPGCQPRIARR